MSTTQKGQWNAFIDLIFSYGICFGLMVDYKWVYSVSSLNLAHDETFCWSEVGIQDSSSSTIISVTGFYFYLGSSL